MTTSTLPNTTGLELDRSKTATTSAPKRRWWNPFTRTAKPARTTKQSDSQRALAEMREEQQRLVAALEKISQRADAPGAAGSSMEIDPMPVIRGIESISAGQKEISQGLAGLNRHLERAEQSTARFTEVVSHFDQTLEGVRSTQADTAGAVNRVGDRIDDITSRFEKLFSKMQEAEFQMAADYRKLQTRTTYAVAGIGAAVVTALIVMMVGPWG